MKTGETSAEESELSAGKTTKYLNSPVDPMSQSPNQIPCLPHRSQRTLEGRSISVHFQKDSHKLSSNYLKCGAHVGLPPISCETYLFPLLFTRRGLIEAFLQKVKPFLNNSPHRLHYNGHPAACQVAAFTVSCLNIKSFGPILCLLGGKSSCGRAHRRR